MAERTMITELLREKLNEAIAGGETFQGIEKACDVLRQTLMPFARGECSMRLDKADQLADYLGLELKRRRSRKGK
jgi:hypothetical protein